MDAAAELGRNPISNHQIQPEYGDEQADEGRDCRTRLAKQNSQARTGIGKYYFFCSADDEQDWQPYPVDPYSCYMYDYTSWWQPATRTNKGPYRDKTLARSNQPRTWGTYPRQDNSIGYEMQLLLYGVLPVFYNLNCKLQRKLPDVLPVQQSHQK